MKNLSTSEKIQCKEKRLLKKLEESQIESIDDKLKLKRNILSKNNKNFRRVELKLQGITFIDK